jgi:hypothetical protein
MKATRKLVSPSPRIELCTIPLSQVGEGENIVNLGIWGSVGAGSEPAPTHPNFQLLDKMLRDDYRIDL